jgi:hypothetical protein
VNLDFVFVKCNLEITEFSPSCKLKPRYNLADYKSCCNTCAANGGMEFFSEYGQWNSLEVHKKCANAN